VFIVFIKFVVFIVSLVLRFANTITYSNEYNLFDCLLGSAEPFGLEL